MNRDVSRATPALFLSGRFAPFDGLRAVAVFLVFAHHLAGSFVPGGWIGVELFFGLSGFLITSLLLREHENRGRINLRAFFARRGLRLVPALVVHVAIVTPLAILAGATGVIPAAVAALTYTTDFYAIFGGDGWIFAHTWSLTVEEQFYLVWPVVLILGLARGWKLLRGLAVVAVLGVAGGAAIAATVSTHVAYATPFSHLPIILGGAALAYAVQRGVVRLERFGTIWIPVVAGVTLVATTFLVDQFTSPWLYYGGMVVLGAPLVLLVAYLCAKPEGPLAKALTLRPLVWLGERSYGFYLWHYSVSAAVHHLEVSRPVAALVALVVSAGLTELSWRLVEMPFLRMKRRYV